METQTIDRVLCISKALTGRSAHSLQLSCSRALLRTAEAAAEAGEAPGSSQYHNHPAALAHSMSRPYELAVGWVREWDQRIPKFLQGTTLYTALQPHDACDTSQV